MTAVHRVETLTRDECVSLLETVPAGRIVFTDRALPAILPLTFVVDDDAVVVRTARGSRLARATDGAVVAFEVDEIDGARCSGWSVVVTGEARVETDPERLRRLDAKLKPWVPGIKDVFIRIPLALVTGRRVTGAPLGSALTAG